MIAFFCAEVVPSFLLFPCVMRCVRLRLSGEDWEIYGEMRIWEGDGYLELETRDRKRLTGF